MRVCLRVWGRVGMVAIMLAGLWTFAVSVTDETRVAAGSDNAGFNVDAIGLDGPSKEVMFGKVGETKFGWIRQQLRWSSYEPSPGQFANGYVEQVDALVNVAAAKGVRILFSAQSSPGWAGQNGGLPNNPQDFAHFISFVANRYQGKVQAYEVWNEQNYAVETGGQVNVGAYIPLLQAGFQAIKAADANATVVFGGLTPTGVSGHPEIALDDVEYLRQIYAINGGEVKNYYDVLGAHPGANCNPPDASWPKSPADTECGTDPDGSRSYTNHNSFYFKRILELRRVMEQAGEGGKQMWLTEFGWDSTSQQVDGYGYAQFISEQQQADYIVRAFQIGRSFDWMGVMFVWNLNFQVTVSGPQDEKFGFGLLRNDWTPRPSFDALKRMNG